jgi:hypothetical protein
MWSELIIIALLLGIAIIGYNAMQPSETCGLSVGKPDMAANNSTSGFPKVELSCKRVV